jgi:hypothetical protein
MRLATFRGIEGEKPIEVWTGEYRHLSTGIVEVGNDGSLVWEFLGSKVDETVLSPFCRWGDVEHHRWLAGKSAAL